MPYFLIEWDAGFGTNADVIEAKTLEAAESEAHDMWKEEVDSNSSYSAEALTTDACENHGYDPEKYGLPPIKYDDD